MCAHGWVCVCVCVLLPIYAALSQMRTPQSVVLRSPPIDPFADHALLLLCARIHNNVLGLVAPVLTYVLCRSVSAQLFSRRSFVAT